MFKIIISDDFWNGAVVKYTPDDDVKLYCGIKGHEATWHDIPETYQFIDVPEDYDCPIKPVVVEEKPWWKIF